MTGVLPSATEVNRGHGHVFLLLSQYVLNTSINNLPVSFVTVMQLALQPDIPTER